MRAIIVALILSFVATTSVMSAPSVCVISLEDIDSVTIFIHDKIQEDHHQYEEDKYWSKESQYRYEKQQRDFITYAYNHLRTRCGLSKLKRRI